jgi:hypothetical protein
MFPGVSGQLLSATALERCVASQPRVPLLVRSERTRLEAWRRRCLSLGPASGLRSLLEIGAEPFLRALGFTPAGPAEPGQDTLILDCRDGHSLLTLVVCRWGARLDPLWRVGVIEARRRHSRWAVLFNGTHARLLDAVRLFQRRHLEFDLDLAVDIPQTGAALWATLHRDALAEGPADPSSILARAIELSDAHTGQVCASLRGGVLAASGDVLNALMVRGRHPHLQDAFEQSLTVVYRMLFLLFAEARHLVPVWHPIYQESYSIDALRTAAEQGRSQGLWDAVRAVSRLAHAGCRAGDLNVTAFNGRLFDTRRAPLVERHNLDDEAALRMVLALTTRPAPRRDGRERIAYGELGVEQLGAVYETLLDYEPKLIEPLPQGRRHEPRTQRAVRRGVGRPQAASFNLAARSHQPLTAALVAGSGVRKQTGTFYTPESIAHYLVRRALAPLVQDRTADEILTLKVLDPAMGSAAFLVAACGFLAHAYEEAMIGGGVCRAGDLGPQQHAEIRRLVAERCLFGVDLNPMAVQLARLSLWLATLAGGRPLSFLDHHLRCGDSVLGVWLSCLRRAPGRVVRRDRIAPSLLDQAALTVTVRTALPVRFSLAGPNDTAEQVRSKERRLAALEHPQSGLSRWKRVADLWCAQWFAGSQAAPVSAFGALSDLLLAGTSTMPARSAASCLDHAARIAAAKRFFHWELEFPEAFFDPQGNRLPAAGFDAVLGNPPWDMMRADATGAGRHARSRDAVAQLVRFTRDAGIYEAQSKGHGNHYQLFAERAVSLLRPGGRLGLVLPSGFISDQGSAALRRLVFSQCAVDGLVGFENRRQIFPIHRSVRFVLVTATAGSPTNRFGCRLGEIDPAILDDDDSGSQSWYPLRLSIDLLTRLSGDSLAVPDLKNATDLTIAERAASLYPPLGDHTGWAVHFGRELNASDDRDVLSPTHGRGLPVIEGKQIEPFQVGTARVRHWISRADATRLLGRRHERIRLAYRDVASATNRLTLIAGLLPAGAPSTHTVFCLATPLPLQSQYFLCGLFNSLLVNYLVRLRVTSHVTTTIVEQLPIPRRDDAPGAFREIAVLAHRLVRGAKAGAFARLNARVARLYRLSIDEFAHVLATFPLVAQDERDAAYSEYRRDVN